MSFTLHWFAADLGGEADEKNVVYTSDWFDAVHVLQISEVVLTIQTGSRGTQACINAAETIDGVIADLETTVMFAAAGTLNPEPGETFANHRLLSCYVRLW